jgi:hypothetical protein
MPTGEPVGNRQLTIGNFVAAVFKKKSTGNQTFDAGKLIMLYSLPTGPILSGFAYCQHGLPTANCFTRWYTFLSEPGAAIFY